MASTDANDEELVSPSTLWATAFHTPRRNPARLASGSTLLTTPTPTPRRSSPRFSRAKELETTPPPLPKTPWHKDRAEPATSKLTDPDEERRLQALADELFPPSPPRAAGLLLGNQKGRLGTGVNDRDEDDEIVADSEVERELEDRVQKEPLANSRSGLTPDELLPSEPGPPRTIVSRQRRRESRRTSSTVFDLDGSDSGTDLVPNSQQERDTAATEGSPEGEEGALVRRLDQLRLGSAAVRTGTGSEAPAPPTPKPKLVAKAPAAAGKVPRERRRVTISIVDSSSSSSSSEEEIVPETSSYGGEEEEREAAPSALPSPLPTSSRAPETADTLSISSTPASVEITEHTTVSGPVSSRLSNNGASCEQDVAGTVDDEPPKTWPDDVVEHDGVLIYNPTPKKRPVKLTPSRVKSPAPSRLPRTTGGNVAGAESPRRDGDGEAVTKPADGGAKVLRRSSLRIEVDLTCDTSDEDDAGTERYDDDDELLSLRQGVPPLQTPSRPSAPRLPGPAPTPRTHARKPGSKAPVAPESERPEPRLSAADRSRLPLELICELDRAVFRRAWNGLRVVQGGGSAGKGLPDGIEVVWNARLRNTAGRASWKTKKTVTVDGDSVTTATHHAMVELSTKVTDTASKLRHTLAHELCHLAAWAIDGEMKPPHGAAFKRWAKRVMIVRPDIEVTTTHAYEIAYKYRWKCVSAVCGKIFGRHSASIDPATHGCPCGARIVPIDKDGNPKPGYSIVTATGTVVSTPKSERKKSKWIEFLQREGPLVRKENPSLSQPEVFKVVAERWQRAKKAHTVQEPMQGSSSPHEDSRLAESLEGLRL
ncbi:hypothetical protein JCM3774_003404 [Rhodotorula dairenensis]